MRTLLTLAAVLLIAYPVLTTGQQNSTPSKGQAPPITATNPSRLALEIVYFPGTPPSYQTVSGSESKRAGAWYARFARTPGWQLPQGSLPVMAVKIESQFNGETTDIYVSVLRGRLHEREESVATYHLGENEAHVVSELKSFGVEPFEIKVIRVSPTVVTPNNVINKTQSLEVVAIKAVDSTLPQYQLTLRNLSNKTISALWLSVEHDGKLQTSGLMHNRDGKPLIAPGDAYETRPVGVTRAREVGGSYVPQPLDSQNVVLEALIFDDGTWEGIPTRAATFRAFVAGRKFQISDVLKNFERIASNTDLTVSAAIENLRTYLSPMNAGVNDAAFAQVLSEFPNFTKAQQENLRSGVEVVTHDIRKTLLENLKTFETQHPEGRLEDFQAWLLSEKLKYEAWLHRL